MKDRKETTRELNQILRSALAGEDLDRERARWVMEAILQGKASVPWIAGWLVALRQKGESVEEIVGFAEAVRAHAELIHCTREPLVDTCGTGGDGAHTFNISTGAALVAAGAGAHVAKHGNRSVSSRCGSADVMEALGARLELSKERVQEAIDDLGYGFLFAPRHHSALKHAVEPRRELGVRTAFNLLGPLVNPAGAPYQVVGVYEGQLLSKLGEALCELGTRRALLVHGDDGLDELSVCAPSRTFLVDGSLSEGRVDPGEFGLGPHPAEALKGGDAHENAAILREVLEGKMGPRRDAIVLNAAAALLVADLVEDLKEGVARAQQSIDRGEAVEVLRAYLRFSQQHGATA
ncbi:MAG TPA: anthranilate phosphoribosyltransferase [Candidatus Krumholzibacteria bacterium]|nr:anthranilate phosphoribosyltransferase [Candidatus Krumholzibacteria bacterium]